MESRISGWRVRGVVHDQRFPDFEQMIRAGHKIAFLLKKKGGRTMPDVGMFSADKPLAKEHKVVIRYSVEVNGLPVYNESYNVDTLREELEKYEAAVIEKWSHRLKCPVGCRHRSGFSACLTRCLIDGRCCDAGHRDC